MSPIPSAETSVSVGRSMEHISVMLRKYKVKAIQTTYNDEGQPNGLTFVMDTIWGARDFALPVHLYGVAAVVKRDKMPPRYQKPDQVARIAWRNAHDWLKAQLTLIDTGMASMEQVMFPYLVLDYDEDRDPITAFQKYASTQKEITS